MIQFFLILKREQIPVMSTARQAAKVNWIVAYEARSALSLSDFASHENEVTECISAECAGRYITLLRFKKRKRSGQVVEDLLQKFKGARCWIEQRESSSECETVDLSFLGDDNKLKKYVSSGNFNRFADESNENKKKSGVSIDLELIISSSPENNAGGKEEV